MGENLTRRILREHLVEGDLTPGSEIAVRIDQTLTQDATGTMAYLQFEALGMPRVRTELSVSYVDHNMLQTGFENADDHRFLQSIAAKHGVWFSRPGNGICHQVHLERFSAPGKTLLGSDSHTPTCGGVGMLAIGAGGLDVAVAMGGGAFHFAMPKVLGVTLTGRLPDWVASKDVVLEMLRRLTVKGGVGRVIEYRGPGVATLDVPARATITNMGAELGATTSVFPSDARTREYLRAQGREAAFRPMEADADAAYDETLEIDLSSLEPLIALPSSPDRVVPVREVEGTEVAQVCVGSCTNSSFTDLMRVAHVLRGRTVSPDVSMTLTPGSKQVYTMIGMNGALTDMISAGARILEAACGPCIGMGQAPPSGGASVRSFNRNFPGRSGTPDDRVYLASPETCVAAAVTGRITDPRRLGPAPRVAVPDAYVADDRFILPPPRDGSGVEVLRGPNIRPLPINAPMEASLRAEVLLKVGDNVTTDHIMPAGAKVLPLRSNIPAISEFVFAPVDPTFARRAREKGRGVVVGGDNYGQGSSREHAALAPMHLGVKAVLAKTFARIHQANLINFGIVPLTFAAPSDHDRVRQGDVLSMPRLREEIETGEVVVENETTGKSFACAARFTPRQVRILRAGGLLNHTRATQG
ncbi:MAG TPA: aconitate hydratase [Candidatus Thermoplasmatota archaeon]|nr:aconitate hydratase [Candidatus Thermoplasmatota archaeon]